MRHTWDNTPRRDAENLRAFERVTSFVDIPGISKAPHDKSLLEVMYGPSFANRLTLDQFCAVMDAYRVETDEAKAKSLWAQLSQAKGAY